MKHIILDQQGKDYPERIHDPSFARMSSGQSPDDTTHLHFEILSKDLFKVILSFCNSIEYHVLRFVCKYTHKQSHNYNFFLEKKDSNKNFIKEKTPDLVYMSFLTIKEGYLNILIWIKELFPEIFSLDYWISYNSPAVKTKYFCILEHLSTGTLSLDANMCSLAASEGHLEMLKWAKKNGYNWDEITCSLASKGGHLEILKWARENNCPWDEVVCVEAANGGHFSILKWARENGCPWNEDVCSEAACNGHIEILKWARENGCPWNKEVSYLAAYGGHLEILKWARENKCPWGKGTCILAASKGHLEILKWASKNGCPWNENVCSAAALGGHFETLKWAR
jgi:hypothetical protein